MRSLRAPLLLLTLVVTVVASSCELPQEEDSPVLPLRPLAYTQSTSRTPEQAEAQEKDLLDEFRKTGRIPLRSTEAQPSAKSDRSPRATPDSKSSEPKTKPASAPDAPTGTVTTTAPPVDLSRPRGLAEATYRAIVGQDRALYERLLIDAPGLQALAGVRAKTAQKRAVALRQAAEKTYGLFSAHNSSEEPDQGLAAMLEMKDVKVGKPGTLWGKTPRGKEETVQYWGTDIVFALKPIDEAVVPDREPSQAPFSITLGRMLKAPSGQWHLASAPSLSGNFKTFLTAGFHLKPELLQPEHYAFPLSVGNFWLFRVRKGTETGDTKKMTLTAPVTEEVRVEVTHVEQGRGYRVVTLQRHDKDGEDTKVETFYYLITPKRLYSCNRYCNSRSKDLGFVLDYVRQRVPLLVLPMGPNMAWGPGGERVEQRGKTYTAPRLELTVVPAGEFSETVVVVNENHRRRQTRHFKPGLGFVRREVETSAGPRVEELVKFRILSAE